MRQKTIEMKDSYQSTNAGLLILGVHHKVKKIKAQICSLHRTVANEPPWQRSALSRCFSSYLLFYVNIYVRFCVVRVYVFYEKWLIVLFTPSRSIISNLMFCTEQL